MPVFTQREKILQGGFTNTGLVFRVGDTVRRPLRPTSQSTKALLDHFERVGFSGAPRYLGIDAQGREMLSYISGEAAIAPHADWTYTDTALVSVARLLRACHDASASFDPTPYEWPHPVPARFRGRIVSHNDPNLDNIIFRGGRAVALIDFDLASPGSAAWDLACAARLWAPLRDPEDAPDCVRERMLERLGLFVDAYGADRSERVDVVSALPICHEWCYAIVQNAVRAGHTTFSRQWHGGGRERAERTSRWLAEHSATVAATMGLTWR